MPTRNLMNWKRRGGRILRASGLPLTIIRPGWFGSNEPRAILQQGDSQEYGPVAVQHVATAALIAGLEYPGHTVELFSGPGAPVTDWGSAFGAQHKDAPRALDGAGDPANLPEASEPKVCADRTRPGPRSRPWRAPCDMSSPSVRWWRWH